MPQAQPQAQVIDLPQRQATAAATAEILNEEGANETVIIVGGRAFTVKALSAKRGALLIEAVGDSFEVLAEAGLFNPDALAIWPTLGEDRKAIVPLLPRIAKAMRIVPGFFETALGLMLGVADKQQQAWLFDELLLTQIPEVIEAWMKANPWRDITDSFFRLGAEWFPTLLPQDETATNSTS